MKMPFRKKSENDEGDLLVKRMAVSILMEVETGRYMISLDFEDIGGKKSKVIMSQNDAMDLAKDLQEMVEISKKTNAGCQINESE